MSFFISDSLKGVISEEDLKASSPIKIKDEKTKIYLSFETKKEVFKFVLLKVDFNSKTTQAIIQTETTELSKILTLQNNFSDYYISIDDFKYDINTGTLKIRSLEINNEDNYVTCKIDIIK